MTRSLLASALVVAVFTVAAPAQEAGRKVALLAAVQDYAESGLANLKYCENDIAELAKVLRTQGYREEDIIVLTDAESTRQKLKTLRPTATNIRAKLKTLTENLTPADSITVALSGHGAHLKKDDALYFCPEGCNLNDTASLYPFEELYATLEASKAGVKLVFLDACRNDPSDAKAGMDGKLKTKTSPQLLKPPGGLAVFFSCSHGEKSYESDTLKHGIFFFHVIAGLKGGLPGQRLGDNADLSINELGDYLNREVPKTLAIDKNDARLKQSPEMMSAVRGRIVVAKLALDPFRRFPIFATLGERVGVVREFDVCGDDLTAIWHAAMPGDGRVMICCTRGQGSGSNDEAKPGERVFPPTLQMYEVGSKRLVRRYELSVPVV